MYRGMNISIFIELTTGAGANNRNHKKIQARQNRNDKKNVDKKSIISAAKVFGCVSILARSTQRISIIVAIAIEARRGYLRQQQQKNAFWPGEFFGLLLQDEVRVDACCFWVGVCLPRDPWWQPYIQNRISVLPIGRCACDTVHRLS